MKTLVLKKFFGCFKFEGENINFSIDENQYIKVYENKKLIFVTDVKKIKYIELKEPK